MARFPGFEPHGHLSRCERRARERMCEEDGKCVEQTPARISRVRAAIFEEFRPLDAAEAVAEGSEANAVR
jgi:hypothetical protein